MKIIVGHSNMDLDCFGSIVLAKHLYPDHIAVKSSLVSPVARNLYNLYQNHLDLMPVKELRGTKIEEMVIVDTRSRARVKEYLDNMEEAPDRIIIYDHHPGDTKDFEDAVLYEDNLGSNTALLCDEIINHNIPISGEDATIALTGIYADTGNFTHENVTNRDFKAAEFLRRNGGSIKLVKSFLKSLTEQHQITLLHDALNRLVFRTIKGHLILHFILDLPSQQKGLAAVVEKIFEIENPDAIFGIFRLEKEDSVLLVARSQKERIEVNNLLKTFGGGGHQMASSAYIKKADGRDILGELTRQIEETIEPAVTAKDLMTGEVFLIDQDWSLLEASIFLEKINHTGAPVVDENKNLTGFMTLRDIMKGRKVDQMHSPVRAYMTKKVVTCQTGATIREMADLFYSNNIGHLPVVKADMLAGILTRSDYLDHIGKTQKRL
jgi:tRNA nucleotidyltransferase (CCA-adding enzyme)